MPKGPRKFHFSLEKSGLTRFGGLSLFQSFCKCLDSSLSLRVTLSLCHPEWNEGSHSFEAARFAICSVVFSHKHDTVSRYSRHWTLGPNKKIWLKANWTLPLKFGLICVQFACTQPWHGKYTCCRPIARCLRTQKSRRLRGKSQQATHTLAIENEESFNQINLFEPNIELWTACAFIPRLSSFLNPAPHS